MNNNNYNSLFRNIYDINKFYITGYKKEFFFLSEEDDNELVYYMNRYVITLKHTDRIIKVVKTFGIGSIMPEKKFELNIYELIEKTLYEFRTSKKYTL